MKVFTNTAMSLDGKIGTWKREHAAFGTAEDHRVMSLLRAQADAVLVGGVTFRNHPLPLIEEPAVHETQGQSTRRTRPMVNAVLTRSGDGPRTGPFFNDPRTLPVIFTGKDTDLSGLSPRAQVHRHPENAPSVEWAVEILKNTYQVENLLVEAGGSTIFQLLAADLVDEINVTVCPLVIGGTAAPTLADGQGFLAHEVRHTELVAVRQVGSELFLTYRVLKAGQYAGMRPVL